MNTAQDAKLVMVLAKIRKAAEAGEDHLDLPNNDAEISTLLRGRGFIVNDNQYNNQTNSYGMQVRWN